MIAQTPPMGWNSWDCYGASVDEATVRQNADYMAAHLKAYGWDTIVVDIQWYQRTADSYAYEPFAPLTMDGYGRLTPAENRFPSAKDGKGFQPLADYVHGLGLKFGIHIMRGMPRLAAHYRLPVQNADINCAEIANPNSICTWNPDMYGLRADLPEAKAYYDSIFALYAQWGVDFVKVDDIAREYPHCKRELEILSAACRGCRRDIVLSLSPGPAPLAYAEHLKQHSNMWRITDDFWDDWELLKAMFERAAAWCIHSGAGHWPDADMLPVGAMRQCDLPDSTTRFTQAEQTTMLTLWCIMRSPLMIGGEMTKFDDFTLRLLTNRAVLDILTASHCAHPLYTTEDKAAWIAPRKDGTGSYLALFNLADTTAVVVQSLADLDLASVSSVTELWTDETVKITASIAADLPPHGAKLYLLRR
mgnify:CR=1 FL=1